MPVINKIVDETTKQLAYNYTMDAKGGLHYTMRFPVYVSENHRLELGNFYRQRNEDTYTGFQYKIRF